MATKKHFKREIRVKELYTDEAKCRQIGDHIFFEDITDSTYHFSIQAKKICAACPLIEKCRDYALQNRVLGIWGGTSYAQRAQYWRKNNVIPKEISIGEAV
jgi:hypothetical protein